MASIFSVHCVRNAAQHLRHLPISVTSLPDHADLAELEAEVPRLRDHRLLLIEGLSHLETQHRLSPALMLGRLRRLAASLGQSVICPVSRSQLEAGDAEIAFQIEEIREDDLCAAQVQIVKNHHGGDGSVNLAWNGLRETLSSHVAEQLYYGGQRFSQSDDDGACRLNGPAQA